MKGEMFYRNLKDFTKARDLGIGYVDFDGLLTNV